MLRQSKRDQFLILRNGILYYWRRVPKALSEIDARAPIVRQSLRTDDLAKARAQRDILKKADNELWAAMLIDGKGSAEAIETYRAAKLLSESLGFSYRPADELARRPVEEIVQRVTAIMGSGTPAVVSTAVMGGEQVPKVRVSEALDIYCSEIVADEIAGKSPAQRKQWQKVKRRAINSFIAVVEDKAMTEINRDDARAFHKHWLNKVVPKDGGPRIERTDNSNTIKVHRHILALHHSCLHRNARSRRSLRRRDGRLLPPKMPPGATSRH